MPMQYLASLDIFEAHSTDQERYELSDESAPEVILIHFDDR